jgi:hypothetical protein
MSLIIDLQDRHVCALGFCTSGEIRFFGRSGPRDQNRNDHIINTLIQVYCVSGSDATVGPECLSGAIWTGKQIKRRLIG